REVLLAGAWQRGIGAAERCLLPGSARRRMRFVRRLRAGAREIDRIGGSRPDGNTVTNARTAWGPEGAVFFPAAGRPHDVRRDDRFRRHPAYVRSAVDPPEHCLARGGNLHKAVSAWACRAAWGSRPV